MLFEINTFILFTCNSYGVKQHLKKPTKIALAVITLLVILPIFVLLDFLHYIHKPLDRDLSVSEVVIYPGQGFSQTLQTLESEGIVSQPDKFRFYARLKGFDKQLKAGEYSISGSMSPADILHTMVKGRVKLYRVTIPEGYNIKQIAILISAAGMVPVETFINTAMNEDFAKEMGIAVGTFEGYLFPETYYFPKGTDARKIISTMVRRFRDVFKEEWKERAENIDFSVHEVVTLASIIEKETGASFERPLISSVFHNRLKRGMRLEADPTVIYGLKNFNGNLTRKHLMTPTPYNTYLIYGLPAGPIANPGKAAIEAALFPADTNYLYFVSKKDNTHQFSTNIRDHNNAVKKYQLNG